MYALTDFTRFALSEFERGLEGLTEDEARRRMPKADGTEMNAISWTVGHLAWHWHFVQWVANDEPIPARLLQFANGSTDPTPPSLEEARGFLAQARAVVERLGKADEATLATVKAERSPESVGTQLMRVTLHTWFHTGEVNAVRQMLGHPEIRMVGRMRGNLEYQPGQGVAIGVLRP